MVDGIGNSCGVSPSSTLFKRRGKVTSMKRFARLIFYNEYKLNNIILSSYIINNYIHVLGNLKYLHFLQVNTPPSKENSAGGDNVNTGDKTSSAE